MIKIFAIVGGVVFAIASITLICIMAYGHFWATQFKDSF